MIEAQAIQISLKENIEEKLYIEVTCMAGEEKQLPSSAEGIQTLYT